MLERFTERARRVMALANQEAQHLHHEYIGTEHLLSGIIKEGKGIAASMLAGLDVDLARLARELQQRITPGNDTAAIAKLPQTPATHKVIELAIEEARRMHHNYVGTEHLLLGLLLESEGIAAQTLGAMEVTADRARAEMVELLSPEAAEPTDSSSQLLRRAVECLLRAQQAAIAEGNSARADEVQTHAQSVGALLTRKPQTPASGQGK